ncbi:uncharacterized protein LOC121728806 [Aricia agestis]|uniref:uncharacterized protein LOC121728806 n=1 Tax=Aricia agestis TaxID=91739 RepID=UPI001C2061C6|nr:uncharacterized protein LOC121728806 [Aricia agestis]
MADVSSNDRKIKLNKNGKVVKRRQRNPEEWHKQKQKRLRIAGLEYVNANGKIVPPKQPGPDCNCRRKCFQKVPEDIRLKTFQGFYSMKTHDEQNAYLFGLMRQVDVKRKRVKCSSRRTCTFEYFVRVKGRETQVCQTAFKNIHAITERKVRVLCKKMDDGVMFPSDNRGRNSHRRSGEVRLPNGVIDQIKNHIYSIVHTHRLKDFIRLDKIAGLEINISKMWKDYIKTYDPDNISATMPKSKRIIDNMVAMKNEHIQQTQPVPQETFAPINYPGQIVNISENYFDNQYQTTLATAGNSSNFYPSQNGSQGMGILVQSTITRPTQPATAFILVQTKPEPHQETITVSNITYTQNNMTLLPEVETKKEQKPKRERKRGPLVKQWRYTNIFHDEINGAALAAIKTRLGMYYAESDAARKKAKQIRPQETVQTQTQTEPDQQMQGDLNVIRTNHQPVRPTHTVTIYT